MIVDIAYFNWTATVLVFNSEHNLEALVRFYSVEEKELNVFLPHPLRPPAGCSVILALTPYCARHYNPSWRHFDQRIRSRLSHLGDRSLKTVHLVPSNKLFRRIFLSTFKCHMLNINVFIAAGAITSPAICLSIKGRKHRFTLTIQWDRFTSNLCNLSNLSVIFFRLCSRARFVPPRLAFLAIYGTSPLCNLNLICK